MEDPEHNARSRFFRSGLFGLFHGAGSARIETKLWISGTAHDFDVQEGACSAFGKERVHRLQQPMLPAGLRLGNRGVQHECAVEVELIPGYVEDPTYIYYCAGNRECQ